MTKDEIIQQLLQQINTLTDTVDAQTQLIAQLNQTIQELKDVVYDDHDAGKSCVFDPLGVNIAMEEKIDLYMVNGRDIDELRNAILGNEIKGTFVNSHQ